ncbi:HDIG domain-containing protein [Malonomonas rubra DSM 5091]|uniref:HDIG domain-containing protein n=1 Tax=Malonomonas rubra DSM 5091 TaxID=1122189 RepID=A0A1M6GAD3_MALRU|nr:HDOD domain-containing protein [Malonomonas rubra]SHJ06844.1 HDIG domain-containing protein [Malonomonas rubra DSM 5091]
MDHKITMENLQEIIQSIPLLSASASRLLQVTANPDHELEEVISLVKTDANLTARVLKVVNSAAFGLMTEITSIDRAISYLGERIIVSIAIGDCAGKLFEKELSGYEAAGGALWKHDLRTAIAARELVVQSGADISPDLAFTAGLLHDIGKSLISDYLKDTAPDAVSQISSQDSYDYLAAEEKLVGIPHTVAGYELAKAWQLPNELCEVILHHHKPSEAAEEARALTYAVHLGDNIAMLGGFGTGSDSLQYHLDSGYNEYLNLPPKVLDSVMLEVDIEFQKLEQSLEGMGG